MSSSLNLLEKTFLRMPLTAPPAMLSRKYPKIPTASTKFLEASTNATQMSRTRNLEMLLKFLRKGVCDIISRYQVARSTVGLHLEGLPSSYRIVYSCSL